MEILTLLKANIRHKKGSFLSIIILIVIISMSFTAIFSIKENSENSINNALDNVNAGDLILLANDDAHYDELLESVKEHPSVKAVDVKETICTLGAEFGEIKVLTAWFMRPYTDEYRLLNEDLSGYAKETAPLEKGEMYIPQGLGSKLGCGIGDNIKVTTIGGTREFTVKGFVVEPVLGGMNISAKQVFISDEDFSQLQEEAINTDTNGVETYSRIIQVHMADESISDNQFKHQLNLDTGIIDYSPLSITKSQSLQYTNILPDLILSALLVFVTILVGVVLIVIAHSISTSIEMEYTTLGVLKAQGFTENKIKTVFALQYLIAEIIGAVIGVVLALPLIKIFGNIFQPMTGIPSENRVSVLMSILFILVVLAISVIFIYVSTYKIGKISPMKAISGGRKDIYFDSRLNVPISKRGLSASLALRQFTSNKRRYISTMLIITILIFFMITMNVLGRSMDSKSAKESMGVIITELDVSCNEGISEETVRDIESIIEKYTEIEKKYYCNSMNLSLNGSEYYCTIYKNPDAMVISEGRYPKYENEIAVTEILADELNLEIGDKVTVSNGSFESEYIITGKNYDYSNIGVNFSMPLEAAKKLDIEDILDYDYSLKDATESLAMAEEINEKYSDVLTAIGSQEDPTSSVEHSALDAMTLVIYVISIVFSLVVVMMVCKKSFLQERQDIGIYKSLGFTSSNLRLQFAVRFLIVSLIGSIFGSILSVFFTEKVLSIAIRLIGYGNFNGMFTVMSFVIPVSIISVSFFIFAYLASGKIKKVEIKELVVE